MVQPSMFHVERSGRALSRSPRPAWPLCRSACFSVLSAGCSSPRPSRHRAPLVTASLSSPPVAGWRAAPIPTVPGVLHRRERRRRRRRPDGSPPPPNRSRVARPRRGVHRSAPWGSHPPLRTGARPSPHPRPAPPSCTLGRSVHDGVTAYSRDGVTEGGNEDRTCAPPASVVEVVQARPADRRVRMAGPPMTRRRRVVLPSRPGKERRTRGPASAQQVLDLLTSLSARGRYARRLSRPRLSHFWGVGGHEQAGVAVRSDRRWGLCQANPAGSTVSLFHVDHLTLLRRALLVPRETTGKPKRPERPPHLARNPQVLGKGPCFAVNSRPRWEG